MVARGSLWGHPGHRKRLQSMQNNSTLHKYFAHRFQRASWPALWQKPRQNYMAETVFGLRRRERIACWPFYEKLVRGPYFLKLLASFWVPNGATWVILGSRWHFFSPLGSVSLSGLWKSPENHLEITWKPRQPHIKSEGKVYLSDKTYD